MDNKNVFAANLRHYMYINNKSRKDVCEALGFSYYTFSDWVKGKKYPRMDKVEILANYFGCLKSDLIEDKTKQPTERELSETKLVDYFFLFFSYFFNNFRKVIYFFHFWFFNNFILRSFFKSFF